jgi:6-phosphofructokinase 1
MPAGMRIAVLTSGGDAPGMNATLRTLVKVAVARQHEVLGVRDGYLGLMGGDLVPLGLREVDGITRFGGTILGSARALEMHTPEGRGQALRTIAERGIGGLVVVGGNGSLTGAHVLAAETDCRVIGIPASIDNDIGHTASCIGVDTAVNTIVDACDRISDTATAHRRAFVVEVMGRDNGFLAMRAGLAAEADAILYPERRRGPEETVQDLCALLKRSFSPDRGKRRVLIVKSEGYAVKTHALVEQLQAFLRREVPGVDVRETVLGHVVRGGSPAQADRVMAQRFGFGAALALETGATDVMLSWDGPSSIGAATVDPRVRLIPLADVLAETERVRTGESDTIRGRQALLERAEKILAL